ncbi:PspA/IM30 family protein [Sulfurimonas sp.]|uniref:PspA/IM30 family protein n=1 Tax=Sulfurimonas sp. TaxID=2022749 RepID=UPI003D0C2657
MNESITRRVARLISGNINALIEAAENSSPEIVMKESIREIQDAISEIKDSLGKSIVESKMISDKIKQLKETHSQLLEQSKIALKEDREDLAKAAIAKQMDIEAQKPILEENLKEVNASIKKDEEYIVALQGKIREMEDAIKAKQAYEKEQSNNTTASQKADKAEQAFNRVAGLGSNLDQVAVEEASKLAELADLQRNTNIEDRLAALKTTLND